jgi:uncharacterized membrane protein
VVVAAVRAAAARAGAGDMNLKRVLKHLFAPHWLISRAFPRGTLNAIESGVRASEKKHEGELRFAIEAGLHPILLLRGYTARHRAVEVFSNLRVWDTAHNSGVLIYVQFIDRRIEIVADRGITARVPQLQWDAVCRRMEEAFRQHNYEQGVLAAIGEITALLAQHFPPAYDNPNELPDRPVVL